MDIIDRARHVTEMDLNRRIREIRAKTAAGESAVECEACGEEIPEGRRKAVPGCTLCVKCQMVEENPRGAFNGR